jgi:hypothetical protein
MRISRNIIKWSAAGSLIFVLALMIGCAQATPEPELEPQQTLPSPQDALSSQTPVLGEQTGEPGGPATSTVTPEREVRVTPTVTPTGTVQVTLVTAAPGTRSATTGPFTPAVPTEGTKTATPIPQPTIPPATGDTSGNQDGLSAEEQAALNAGNATYSGQRCRIDTSNYTCNCIPDTITATFTFPNANAAQMIFTATTGTATYQLGRKGINTWISSSTGTTDEGTVTTDLEIIFNLTGFQQLLTVRFPGGQAPTCTSNWTRP